MAALAAAFGVACGSSQLALQLVDPAQPHRGSQFVDWGSALLGCTTMAWTQSCSMHGDPPASASEQSQAYFSSRSPGFRFRTSRTFRQKPMSDAPANSDAFEKQNPQKGQPALRIS